MGSSAIWPSRPVRGGPARESAPQPIQEFAQIRARRRTRNDAVTLARSYVSAFALLAATADDLDRGLTLFEQNPGLGAFDAVLAAVALERGAEALVSAARAFGSVRHLPWVDPATPAWRRIING